MIESEIPKEDFDNICAFVAGLEVFKNMKGTVLKEFVASMTLIQIAGFETLIHEGALDDSLFILYRGRLSVFRGETWVADIDHGRIVGENAFLSKEPRTSTVRAIRDSLLLKLTSLKLEHFEKDYPYEAIILAKTALKRLLTKPKFARHGENMVTIAVVPAGNSNHRTFTEFFLKELNKFKPSILINSSICSKHFEKDVSQVRPGDPDNHAISSWLQSLESRYGYIIFETDYEMNGWSERCLRQADRIIFIAEENVAHTRNAIENSFFSKDSKFLPLSEMIFIHPDDCTKIEGTINWISLRPIKHFHHLRLQNGTDWRRVIRRLTGNCLGIALSGGGARAFAQIGALCALEELNIPFDLIFGSSMGAVMAVGFICFGGQKSIELAINFSKSRYMDYTLPFLSLLKGKNLCDFTQSYFQEIRIEDLWMQFCCISTNLTKCNLEIHDRGLIWQSLRSTVSIPGIFPPLYTGQGDMLVDGGIINNLPADLLRNYMTGGKILAITCLTDEVKGSEFASEKFENEWTSGWRELFRYCNPFSKTSCVRGNIFDIIMNSVTLSAESHQRKMEKEVDYLLKLDTKPFGFLEFKSAEKIIEAGYNQAMEKIPHLIDMNETKSLYHTRLDYEVLQ